MNDKRKELVEKLEKDTTKKPTNTIGNNAVKKPKPEEEEEEEDDFDKEFDMIVKKKKEQEAAKSKIISITNNIKAINSNVRSSSTN